MFLKLIFCNNFSIFSILAKCVHNENCRTDLAPTSPKALKLAAQTDLPVEQFIDEEFAIN